MWIRRIVAAALILVGAVWFAQGINVLQGSPMTGNPFWAFVGLPMVIVGVLVLRPAKRDPL